MGGGIQTGDYWMLCKTATCQVAVLLSIENGKDESDEEDS